MRTLALLVPLSLLITACGADGSNAGCHEGQLLPCSCDDGSAGTRVCGAAECVCAEDPTCDPGETIACTCVDGRAGTRACGTAACICEEPDCRDGELVGCTCTDGRAGQQLCGEQACACVPAVCTLRHVDGIEFGAVPPGTTAARELVLANEGDAACTIAAPRLDGCGSAFGLAASFTSVTVEPGAELAIPVSFHAEVEQQRLCALVFDVPEDEIPQRIVYLTGTADSACLTVGPLALDLGEAQPGCAITTGDVTIDNSCGVSVRLDGLEFDGGDAFLLLSEPSVPFDVAPGTRVSVKVGYRPRGLGTHAGELRVALTGFDLVEIPVIGRATDQAWTRDSFRSAPLRKVDLLLVIDNGSAMADDVAALRNNLVPFLSCVRSMGIDYHIGVTTTGLEPGGDCPGGVGGGEDGRLFPVVGTTARILSADTADVEAAWRANFEVGACRVGPNRAFDAVVRALTPPVESSADDPRHPEEHDGNAGFLRDDAHLSVIVISDRDDDSPEPSAYYYYTLKGLKGPRASDLFGFHAIAGDRDTGCTGGDGRTAAPADRLRSLVDKTGGVFETICAPEWPSLRSFSSTWTPPICFPLSRKPSDLDGNGILTEIEGELEVIVNGITTPSRGPQRQTAWYYSADEVALCFSGLYFLEPESTIEVRYRAACW